MVNQYGNYSKVNQPIIRVSMPPSSYKLNVFVSTNDNIYMNWYKGSITLKNIQKLHDSGIKLSCPVLLKSMSQDSSAVHCVKISIA